MKELQTQTENYCKYPEVHDIIKMPIVEEAKKKDNNKMKLNKVLLQKKKNRIAEIISI